MGDTSDTGEKSAPDADESASPSGKRRVGGGQRFAFLWKALSFALVATLVAAAAAFVWRRELLTEELQDHYAGTAARQGRELELAFENYRHVIVNLTRIAETTGQVAQEKVQLRAATARVDALARAKEDTQRIASAAKQREAEAERQRSRLARELDELVKQTEQLDTNLSAAQSKVKHAEQALREARDAAKLAAEASENALATALTAGSASERAADAAARAQGHAAVATASANPEDRAQALGQVVEAQGQAKQAETAALEAQNKATAKATTGVTTPDPARKEAEPTAPEQAKQAVDAASDSAKQAKQAAIETATTAEQKQYAAQQAEAELRKAEQQYEDALTAALKAFLAQTTAADTKADVASKLGAANSKKAQLSEAARTLEEQERAVLSNLRLAAQQADDMAAGSLRLYESILPSYHSIVAACIEQNPKNLKNAELCAAREMARRGEVSKASRPFEVVACPPGLPSRGQASLTADGKSLIFSPPEVGALSACGQVPLMELLPPVGTQRNASIGSRRSFDELVLMRPDGSVIAQAVGSSSARLTKLPGLDEAERIVASQVKGGVALGARKYRAFMQPVAVTMAAGCTTGDCAKAENDKGGVVDVVLCGLIDEDRLFGESLEVSPGFFLWTLVLLCFGVLAVPLAKLWFVGPMSRFRRFDVALLAISALAATFLAVILVLATTNYFGLRDRLDAQLQEVGGAAAKRMQDALTAAQQQIKAYRESTKQLQAAIPGASEEASISGFQEVCRGAASNGRAACKASALLEDPGLTQQGDRWSVCEQVQCLLGAPEDGDVIAFVSDRDGNQWVRSVTGAHAPNPVNIAQRSYFTQAVRREGCLEGSRDAPCITAEVVRSNSMGQVVLVAASPIQANGPDSHVQGITGVAHRIHAFENAVLPLGLELAIIDREGRIMVHSDRESRQGQSIMHDFDKPQEIFAAMNAGAPDTMTRRYRGEVVRLHLRPIREAGWSVLVMGPRGLVDVITADIVGLTLVGFGTLVAGCLIALCFLALVVWCLRRRRKPAPGVELLSLRPNPAQRVAYGFSGAAMLSAGVVLSAGCLFFEVPTFPALALALGAATIGVMVVPGVGLLARYLADGSSFSSWLLKRLPGISLKSAYSSCCFGLGVVLVVLPTVIIFEASRDHTLDTLVRAEQQAYLKGDAGARCLDTPNDARCRRVFRAATIEKPGNDSSDPRPVSCWLWPAPCLADLLPVLGPSDGAWNGREYRAEGWQRRNGNLVRGGVATPLPMLPLLQPRYFFMGMLCLFMLGILAYLVTRASASRLLMIGVLERLDCMRSPGDTILPKAPESSAKPLRYLVLGASSKAQSAIRTADPSAVVVVLDEVLNTPSELEKLEQIVEGRAKLVVLFSQREPMRQVLASEASPELAQRWATLLQRFQTVHAPAHTVEWKEDEAGEVSRAHLVSLWSRCTDEEKRLLAQFAIEGYVNPNPQNREAVMDLARRGLIDANTLTIPNRAFGEFITQTVTSKQFAHWEEDDGRSAYRALRTPLLLAVVLILGVVLVVNPSLAALGPLVPALAGGLPKMLQIVATMFSGEADLGD